MRTKKMVFYYMSSQDLKCFRSEENVIYAYAVFQVGFHLRLNLSVIRSNITHVILQLDATSLIIV